MTRPLLLDLFCGAGGAAMGYYRAGFDVIGVDIVAQPHYPFDFWQEDALDAERMVRDWRFDAVHASPPCQAYSTATRDQSLHPDLYEPTRDMLQGIGLPYVIENVPGAPFRHGLTLCGTMFGLEHDGEWLKRHRNFETPFLIMQSKVCRHRKNVRAITITGKCYLTVTKDCARHSRQPTFKLAQQLMGIDWMTRTELSQAIPPAYTQFIGEQLLEHLNRALPRRMKR
jgi:DNA (cytosine-5)-methyltransferase 1